MMNVFYAHSTFRESIYQTFLNICDNIDKNKVKILDVDENNNSVLLDKIKESINKCDMFVCDITPDYIDTNDNIFINANVMLELGYAIEKINKNNILILLDTSITKKRPSLIEGYHYLEYDYDSNDKEYFNHILGEIYKRSESDENKYSLTNGWKTFNYEISERNLEAIEQLSGVVIKEYMIRINHFYKKMVILIISNGYNRVINIETKEMKIKEKLISLTTNKELIEELRHIELIVNLREFIKK